MSNYYCNGAGCKTVLSNGELYCDKCWGNAEKTVADSRKPTATAGDERETCPYCKEVFADLAAWDAHNPCPMEPVAITESELSSLRADAETLRMLEEIWTYTKDNQLCLFAEEKYAGRCQMLVGQFDIILGGKINEKVDYAESLKAAIRELHAKIKEGK